MNGSDTSFCHHENLPQKKKNFWFEKKALFGADYLLSVSEFTARESSRLFNLKEEIKVIPNSVNVVHFNPTGGKVTPNTILYFGSIIRKKGVLELAEIFNQIADKNPQAHFLIAGRDVIDHLTKTSTKGLMLKKISRSAKKRVQWLGTLPYEKIMDQITGAQVVVLPSFAEALPMTWLEAMAMEKALVTSNIGWAGEVMVNEQTGFTVDPKDHETYANKVLQLMTDSGLSEKMGKTARKMVKRDFSTSVIIKKNIDFYTGIINS